MPVLPEVGSINTVLPALIWPCASSASIIATPIRSLTEAMGVEKFELGDELRLDPALCGDPVETHQRRIADGLGDGIINFSAPRLFRRRPRF